MDAYAHLRGLGWKGEGYSLGRSNNGLKKPLLIAHKHDLRGIGLKQQKEKQADQWWLNAFDSTLKDIGSEKTQVCALSFRESGNTAPICCVLLTRAVAAKSSARGDSS